MKRVLIVDDREENLRYIETLLGRHGYAVDSASDGAEALDSGHRGSLRR